MMIFNVNETTLGILVAECDSKFYSHLYNEIHRNEYKLYAWTEISKELYNLLKAELGTSSYQEEVFEEPVWCDRTHRSVEIKECVYDENEGGFVSLTEEQKKEYVWSEYSGENLLFDEVVDVPTIGYISIDELKDEHIILIEGK